VTAQSASQTAGTPQQQAARRNFENSPEFKAFRGFIGCAYVTILSQTDAKAKGIVLEGGRPGLIYVPGIGMTFVQALELPQGGGSLRASPAPGASVAPNATPAATVAPLPSMRPSPSASP
jgi:hypothetical protein